jgi:Ser/Thr protein kinase RdoA (MazF antagonist)
VQSHPFEQLTPDTVIDAVESTGIVSDARILALNSYENRVYQVGVEDDVPVIAKFYRPGRWSLEQILEEHAFSQELADLDIPVVSPMSLDTAANGTVGEFNGFRFALFPRRGGRSPDLSLDNLLIMGRFIGRLHKVGAVRPFQQRQQMTVKGFAEDSAAFLLEQDFIPADLRQAYNSLAEDLINRIHGIMAGVSSAAQIRIHGDCHMGNVLWRDDIPHFVDFDDTMTGPAIQDLWMLLSGDRQMQLAQLSELIDGYNEFHDFNPAELGLIEALRTMRLMHYSAWLARRWNDPAFPQNFPWFNSANYWAGHILELREQLSALDEPSLVLY